MSEDLTILRAKSPETAAFVEQWRAKYQRTFDFSKTEDQADFYEGVSEMGRFIAKNNAVASLQVHVTTAGVAEVSIDAA